jgi:hypothetical protein
MQVVVRDGFVQHYTPLYIPSVASLSNPPLDKATWHLPLRFTILELAESSLQLKSFSFFCL